MALKTDPFVLFLLLLLMSLEEVSGAKILGLFPDISRSHSTQNRPLFRALAARGHQVTILSGYPEAKPLKNYRDIVIEGLAEFTAKQFNFANTIPNYLSTTLLNKILFANSLNEINEDAFFSNATLSLIRSRDTFDLIFIDLTNAVYNLGFVHKFGNPPFIGIVPFGSNKPGDMLAGNPSSPGFVPCIYLPLTNSMSFYERFVNTFDDFVMSFYYQYIHFRITDRLISQSFGSNVPSSLEIAKNMSLLMVNTDIAHDYPRPLSPMTIEIGGLHLQPAQQLPTDIKKFIEISENGVIFFSLGSLARSDKISPEKLGAVLETFRSLPQSVLMKWESDWVPNLPRNVMVRKWLPQNDILGHPGVKLFVTHGGISSLEEAVYHSVPMVVIPFFGDQFFQAKKMVHHGIGRKVDYKMLTKETLLEAIQGVLSNSSYRTNINRVSRISRDKIRTPLQTAIFWTEYVLRNGGSQRLRPSGAFEPWQKFFLLDVILALGSTTLLLTFTALFLLKRLTSLGTSRTAILWLRRIYNLTKSVVRLLFDGLMQASIFVRGLCSRVSKTFQGTFQSILTGGINITKYLLISEDLYKKC